MEYKATELYADVVSILAMVKTKGKSAPRDVDAHKEDRLLLPHLPAMPGLSLLTKLVLRTGLECRPSAL
jgi:hypothetical protein